MVKSQKTIIYLYNDIEARISAFIIQGGGESAIELCSDDRVYSVQCIPRGMCRDPGIPKVLRMSEHTLIQP